jgi:hypothetical protein
VDRVEPQPADFDHLGVVDEHVVPDVLQLRRVERGDRDLVSRLAHRRNGLDVVPVTVRLEYPLHPERLAEFEELLMLVRCVEEHARAARLAAYDEHVVVDGADDHLVDLHVGVGPVQRLGCIHTSQSGSARREVGASGRPLPR